MFTKTILLALTTVVALAAAAPGYGHYPPTTPNHSYSPCQQCVSSPNNCDITAPCSSFVDKLYCACRPGYKASHNNYDTSSQWRFDTFPGHEHRVWVAPGVVCDTLCDNPWGVLPCAEVAVRDECAPVNSGY